MPTSRALLIAAMCAALVFTGYHVVRTVSDAIYWHEHRDEPIEGWMTVGYVAHSYHVPPHVLLMALGLPPRPMDKRTISRIALDQGRAEAQLTGILRFAIVHARPPYPPPPPPPPPGPGPR